MKTSAHVHTWWRMVRCSPSVIFVVTNGLFLLCLPMISRAGGTVTNCTEAALRAALAGGGQVNFACDGTIALAATVTITNDTLLDGSGHQVTLSGNHAVRVFQVTANTIFSAANVSIANGRSTYGAGILNEGGTVNVTNITFDGNTVLGAAGSGYPGTAGESVSGGAVANRGVMHLVNCRFTNNTAIGGAGSSSWGGGEGFPGGSGAGGAIENSGSLFSSGCTFAGNSAAGGAGGAGGSAMPLPWPTPGYAGGAGGDGAGGALFNAGNARLVNCTVAFNTGAGGVGGPGGPGYPNPDYPPPPPGPGGSPGAGIGGVCDASGQMFLTNCTVAFNAASDGNGGVSCGGIKTSGATLVNTLLAENLPGGNGSGAIQDLGHNLSSDTSCAFTDASSLNNTYALLGPLTNNGGPTLTIALLSGCRAIDAGDTAAAPPTDQRGVPRPFGAAADMGAYEYNAPTNPGPSTVVAECTEMALRVAMSGGGHVTFACDGTIQLSNTVVVTTNTLLDGAGHQITLRGNGVTAFQVSSDVAFSLANLAIAGAGLDNAGGTLNATNCRFSGNVAASGGAIRNGAGAVSLSACVFTDNHALATAGGGSVQGGAVNNSGTMRVDLCNFVANSAQGGSGLPGDWYGASGGPGGDAAGGAICNFGSLTISRSSFTTNLALAGCGAGGYYGHHGDPGMNGGNGGNGGAGGSAKGGALYNAGSARVISSTFAFNSGMGGCGGVGGEGGPNYGGPGQGGDGGSGGTGGTGVGAILNLGDIHIINSTFAFNSGLPGTSGAGGNGGSGNLGGSGGSGGNGGSGIGALNSQSTSCQITNCTFAGNWATGAMGGAGGAAGHTDYPYGGYGGSPGAPGSPGAGGGGITTSGGKLVNTVLAANLPGGNCAGAITDLGHNLSSDSSWIFTNTGSLNNTDPKLGPLANNGGNTLTMALLPGSPAIDAGDEAAAPADDQRGFPRPVGEAPDLGAFEYASPALLTLKPSAGGGFDIFVLGKRGQPCWLLASDTLLNWQPVWTNQFDDHGTVVFHETGGNTQKFYRVFLP